jgi:hypothetical protein
MLDMIGGPLPCKHDKFECIASTHRTGYVHDDVGVRCM